MFRGQSSFWYITHRTGSIKIKKFYCNEQFNEHIINVTTTPQNLSQNFDIMVQIFYIISCVQPLHKDVFLWGEYSLYQIKDFVYVAKHQNKKYHTLHLTKQERVRVRSIHTTKYIFQLRSKQTWKKIGWQKSLSLALDFSSPNYKRW